MTPAEADRLRNPAILQALRELAGADPVVFSLRHADRKDWPVRAMAEQLRCRAKASAKLPAWRHPDLLYTERALQQCSSAACARFKAGLIRGRSVLDCTAGLGVDAWAAAVTGHAVEAWERDPALACILTHDAALLATGDLRSRTGDGVARLAEAGFDWVLCDPDRRPDGRRRLRLADLLPDPTALWDRLTKAARHGFCLKLAPGTPDADLAALPPHQRLFVSWRGECRELLLLAPVTSEGTTTGAVLLTPDGTPAQRFTGPPPPASCQETPDGRLWIADPAVRRAGLVAAAAAGRPLLHPDLPLITADDPATPEPGAPFRVIADDIYRTRFLRRALRELGVNRANVSCFGFPHTATAVARAARLPGGGPLRLLCWRSPAGRLRWLLAERATADP